MMQGQQSTHLVTSVPAAPTHIQQGSRASHHQRNTPISHQETRLGDTESSIIDDLLELTSDEEFMTSSSWQSILPDNTIPGSSQTLPSLQLSTPEPQPSLQQPILVQQPSLQQPIPVPQPSLQQSTPVPQLQQSIPVPQLQHSIAVPQVQQSIPVPHLQHTTPVAQPSQQFTIPVPLQSPQLQSPQLQSPQLQPPPPQLTNSTLQPVNAGTQSIVQPPFSTPPKLLPVERVMMDYPGTDEMSLRRLTTALAREAIFGRDALCRSSLSGKNNTGSLEKHKLDYIKAVVKSRVPNMPEITFEGIWSKCRASLSKSCQTLRTTAKKKILS